MKEKRPHASFLLASNACFRNIPVWYSGQNKKTAYPFNQQIRGRKKKKRNKTIHGFGVWNMSKLSAQEYHAKRAAAKFYTRTMFSLYSLVEKEERKLKLGRA